MENDNSGTGIESAANDMGSMSGTVEAMGGNPESSMSAERGGGFSDGGAQVGSLDLDPTAIGAPIAVMDSRVDDPAPNFIANTTNADAKAIGQSVILGGAATAAILSGGPTAGPLLGMAILSAGTNLEAFAHATMDAQQSMGAPGAFSAESQEVANYDTYGGYAGMGPPPVPDYWQYMGISTGGGGNG